MVTGRPLLTLWAQRGTIFHKAQTFTGYSPVFTGIGGDTLFSFGGAIDQVVRRMAKQIQKVQCMTTEAKN